MSENRPEYDEWLERRRRDASELELSSWEFPVPPTCTVYWTSRDWIDWIRNNGRPAGPKRVRTTLAEYFEY